MKKKLLALTCLFIALPTLANAALIPVNSVSGSGTFNNSLGVIADGTVPGEGTVWTANTNVWWNGLQPAFSISFGDLYTVDEVLVSVDNNDSYAVTWSTDAITWNNLFSISVSDGEIGGGMDTMSTDNTHGEYVTGFGFSSVDARFLRIQATGGDNKYSVGEFQAFGSKASSVPEPAPLALLGLGLLGLGLARKRRG